MMMIPLNNAFVVFLIKSPCYAMTKLCKHQATERPSHCYSELYRKTVMWLPWVTKETEKSRSQICITRAQKRLHRETSK